MNIEQLTKAEAREIARLFQPTQPAIHPYEIGQNYFIRTVTFYYTGKLLSVTEHELVLENAAWIGETGRFSDALKSCNFNEIEPYPDGPVIIGRGAVIDATKISTVPRSQK